MKRMLSKRDFRVFEIINLLVEHPTMTLNEISSLVEISIRTLSDEIKNINSIISPSKIITSQEGILLFIPAESSIREIYGKILSESLEYKLLRYLFFYESRKADDIAEDLFISTSTLARSIKSISQLLNEDEIVIDTFNHCIIGDELTISKMFTSLFLELQFVEEEELIDEDQKAILLTLQNKMRQQGYLTTIFPSRNDLTIWLYVRVQRIKNKHYFVIEEDSNNYDSFLDDSILCQDFLEIFDLNLNSSIIEQMFYPFYTKKYAKVYDDIELLTVVNKKANYLYKNIKELIDKTARTMTINTKNTEELQVLLFNLLQFTNHPLYILYSKSNMFIKKFIKENAVICAVIKKHINSIFPNYNEEAKNMILYYIVTCWEALFHRVKMNFNALSIGILIDANKGHRELILDMIQNSSKAKTIILSLESIRDIESIKTIDVVITNIPNIKLDTTEIVYIDEYLNYNDLRNILLAQERIYRNRLIKSIQI